MDVANGSVVLNTKDCTSCKYHDPQGKQRKMKWRVCEKCKGTGRRGNGKCRNCNHSSYSFADVNPGYVKFYDDTDLEACKKCGGDYKDRENENLSDNLPVHIWHDVPIVVGGSKQRPMSAGEQLFGAGVYTVIDYGRHKASTDEELIAYMRTELVTGKTKVQATKAVRSKDDLTFCSGLAIMRADQGFSVIPYWD
jgi:hypothetical protein